MINSLKIEFSANGTQCVGFSSDKENNFYKDISLIFQNTTHIPISYTITSIQNSGHDFIELVPKENGMEKGINLTPTTTEVNNLFHKTFEFTINPYTKEETLIAPSYEKKLELSRSIVLIDYRMKLIIKNASQEFQYNLFCFQNFERNHNPYEPIVSESDLNSKALPPQPTPQAELLKKLTNNTLTDENETPKPIDQKKRLIFKKYAPGKEGAKRTTPSPEAPVGSSKSCFFVFNINNETPAATDQPLLQTPDMSTLVQSKGPLPRPVPKPAPRRRSKKITLTSARSRQPKIVKKTTDPYLNRILN